MSPHHPPRNMQTPHLETLYFSTFIKLSWRLRDEKLLVICWNTYFPAENTNSYFQPLNNPPKYIHTHTHTHTHSLQTLGETGGLLVTLSVFLFLKSKALKVWPPSTVCALLGKPHLFQCKSSAHFRPIESKMGRRDSNVCFNKPSRWFFCTQFWDPLLWTTGHW